MIFLLDNRVKEGNLYLNMRHLKIFLVFFIFTTIFFISPHFLQSESQDKVYYIPVKGEINFGLAGFIDRSLKQAEENKASLIVLGIDTFGGRVDACFEIVKYIESIKNIPVYAYVQDKSWSAGALIALACQKIFMEKGSSIGSAAPVSGKGKELGEKYVSALRAKFQAIAEKNGYSVNLAKAMVDKDLEVKQVEVNNQIKYLTLAQTKNLKEERKKFKTIETVSPQGKLLNLSYKQAKKYNLASAVVDSLDQLLKVNNLETATVLKVNKNWAEHLAVFFTNGIISSLLLSLGFMLIYLEFAEPGLGWAGLVALACFGLFFFGRYIVNLAQWMDILIFAIGVLLIFLEIFVVPGFGVPGILGGILVLISLYLALSPYKIPQNPWDFDTLQKTLLMLMGSLTASIVGGFVLLTNLDKIPLLRRLVLDKSMGKTKDNKVAIKKQEKLNLGDSGKAETDLRPVGKVIFKGDIYDGISQHGYVEKGEKVKIVEISGNRILVRKEV